MVKVPQAGRVKTRLARGIGVASATAFYRHSTSAIVAQLTRPREWRTILAIAPDAGVTSRMFRHSGPRCAQGSGDLGQRMQHLMDGLPPGPVLIVGSDIPGITAAHIREAFAKLGANDAVFGPAPDGGYWLVGLKRFPHVPRAFRNVRWSSEHALADTRANLNGLKIASLEVLDDIDEAADLARTRGTHGRRISSFPSDHPNSDMGKRALSDALPAGA
jgi:uncharacterized protein